MPDAKTLITQILTRHNQTQGDLAAKLGVTPQALSRALNTPPDLRGIWKQILEEFNLEVALVERGAATALQAPHTKPKPLIPAARAAAEEAYRNANLGAERQLQDVASLIERGIVEGLQSVEYPHLLTDPVAEALTMLGYMVDCQPDDDDEQAGHTVIFWGRPARL